MDYSKQIKEDIEELLRVEKEQTNGAYRDHVKFVRLLKSGKAKTQKEAADLIGVGLRQGQNIWAKYKKVGLSGLVHLPEKGKKPFIKPADEQRLLKRLKRDDIETLAQARQMLKEEFGAQYADESGVWYLFGRLGIKLKTGRPIHVRKDDQAEKEFKKTS